MTGFALWIRHWVCLFVTEANLVCFMLQLGYLKKSNLFCVCVCVCVCVCACECVCVSVKQGAGLTIWKPMPTSSILFWIQVKAFTFEAFKREERHSSLQRFIKAFRDQLHA